MVGMVLLSAVVLGMAVLFTDIFTTYDVDYEGIDTFDKSAEMVNLTSDIRDALQSGETEDTDSSSPFSTIKGAWNSMWIPVKILSVLTNLITDVFKLMHLPEWLGYAVLTIIGITLFFRILYIIFGRKE